MLSSGCIIHKNRRVYSQTLCFRGRVHLHKFSLLFYEQFKYKITKFSLKNIYEIPTNPNNALILIYRETFHVEVAKHWAQQKVHPLEK